MIVIRDPSQLYLYSTALPATREPRGLVQRIDGDSLEVIATSVGLPTGGHIWCGAVVAHANGDLYCANGRYLHRLDPDCGVVAERRLPADAPHNGLLVFDDGIIVTKDIRLGPPNTTIVLLEPEGLDIIAEVVAPEPSMARIAIDGDDLILVGVEHVFRYHYQAGTLTLDRDWQPRYRRDRSGPAWDPCVADGSAWLMDNGDSRVVCALLDPYPAGSVPPRPGPPVRPTPIALSAVDLVTAGITAHEPFDARSGWIIAPPLVFDGIAIAFDTGNSRLGAFDAKTREDLWDRPIRTSMQPLLFPDTSELVVDDISDHLDVVVLDARSGEELGRVGTNRRALGGGMFFTPGSGRDLFMCDLGAVSRLWVE